MEPDTFELVEIVRELAILCPEDVKSVTLRENCDQDREDVLSRVRKAIVYARSTLAGMDPGLARTETELKTIDSDLDLRRRATLDSIYCNLDLYSVLDINEEIVEDSCWEIDYLNLNKYKCFIMVKNILTDVIPVKRCISVMFEEYSDKIDQVHLDDRIIEEKYDKAYDFTA